MSGPPGLHVTHEEMVVPAQSDRPQGPFRRVVVDRDGPVLREAPEVLPSIQARDCCPEWAFRRLKRLQPPSMPEAEREWAAPWPDAAGGFAIKRLRLMFPILVLHHLVEFGGALRQPDYELFRWQREDTRPLVLGRIELSEGPIQGGSHLCGGAH